MSKTKYKLHFQEIKHVKLDTIIAKDLHFFDNLEDNTCIVFITKKELTQKEKGVIVAIYKAWNTKKLNLRITFQTQTSRTDDYDLILKYSNDLEFFDYLKK